MIFKITNYISVKPNCVCVELYDTNNNLIGTECSSLNTFKFNVCYGVYKVKIYFNNYLVAQTSFMYSRGNEIIYYNFNNYGNNTPTRNRRTFTLYDYHYSGLKIERGNLILKSIT